MRERTGAVVSMAAALLLSGVVACGGDSDIAERQIRAGEDVYRKRCASCHDTEGGFGPRLTPRVIRSYDSAGALTRYLELAMPYYEPGSLTGEEYRDLTAYLLDRAARGVGQVEE